MYNRLDVMIPLSAILGTVCTFVVPQPSQTNPHPELPFNPIQTANATNLLVNVSPLNQQVGQAGIVGEAGGNRGEVAVFLPSISSGKHRQSNALKKPDGGTHKRGDAQKGRSSSVPFINPSGKSRFWSVPQEHKTESSSVVQMPSFASLTTNRSNNQTQPIKANFQEKAERTQPDTETRKEQEQEELATKPQKLKLTLSNVVILALQNNRIIKNAYLQRIIDLQELAVAEDEFAPNFTPEMFVEFNRNQLGSTLRTDSELNLAVTLDLNIITGGDLKVTWSPRGRLQDSNNISSIGDDLLSQNLTFSFIQPLLRGFGVDVNRAPIQIARQEEAINIVELKSNLINTITNAIEAYLRLLQAQEQIKIEQLSLESAKRQMEVIEALIDAGRRARVELVQSETEVANREVSLLTARNRLAQAGLDLIEILELEQNLELVAADIPAPVDSTPLESEKLQQLALVNNPDYLQSVSRLEIAKLNLLLAKNERRWNLDFQVDYDLTTTTLVGDDTMDLRGRLTLKRELGNLSLEQAVERSNIQLQQANNNLQEARETLEIEINNRIRDVKFNLRQIQLARQARELSEQQLQNEREKLRLGVRGTRLIDVLDFENDLVQAKNRELNARIDYLRALTRLEQTVGITLDRWNIKIEAAKAIPGRR
ncbi:MULTISPECIES: TolC family protein [Moorena]|nr:MULTISPECIES: TolC family protein [Moorena]